MRTLRTAAIAIALSILCPLGCASAGPVPGAGTRGDGVAVEYTVRLEQPQTQMVEMTMSLRGVKTPTVDVMLPIWRPGRYVVLDPASTLRGFAARSGDGKPLAWEKVDKSAWRITRPEGSDDQVIVDYRIYANSLGDRTRHVDDTHAFLSPASVFMYSPAFRDAPLKVFVVAPEAWDIAGGLERQEGDARTLEAANYDVLADTPLEIGVHGRAAFEVEGVPHEIVVWWGGSPQGTDGIRTGGFYDEPRLTADFAKIVEAQKAVFGAYPYKRYVFLIHCYPGGGGGTEHLNSTVMQCSPEAFQTKARYTRLLSLASHEFFHTWNVKQLRPAGLKPYDYQKENYTDLLWVCEGTTSYYQDLFLVRTGHIKPDDFLGTVTAWVEASRNRPGTGVQSVSESSFDSWIKFNRPNADGVNSTVSFYDKGAHVSLLLDMAIREGSGNTASLDSVMRDLYEKFPLDGPGFTERDLQQSAERHAGRDLSEFFARYVRGTEALDFEGAIKAAGLEVVSKPNKDEGEAGETPEERAYIGINVDSRSEFASVTSVLSDGPAYAAGVLPGDLIVAVNGQRARASDWDRLVRLLTPGDMVTLTLFRMDVMRDIGFDVAARPNVKVTVKRVKEPTELQKAVYESWLGQKWPGD